MGLWQRLAPRRVMPVTLTRTCALPPARLSSLSQYATRCNTEFAKLGARGVSLLVSSGDGGVAGSQTSPCPGGVFIPNFPAASPFVTAVGGTTGA